MFELGEKGFDGTPDVGDAVVVLHEALVFGRVEAATRPIAPEQSGSLAQFLVRG